jgi:phage head maturation protease
MSGTALATERRAAKIELRDVDITAGGLLAATAVPYNEKADIGFFTEAHLAGSFAKSITEAARGLPLHVFHDDMTGHGEASSWPIGVATEWNDDGDRLRGVWKLYDDEKSQRARKLATPDEEGNAGLGYMSIRFQPIRSNWQQAEDWNPDLGPDHKDHVDRIESRLVSVALVSTPAFIGATVEYVRSAPPPGRRGEAGARQIDAWSTYLAEIKAGPR